eukprot:3879893-Amphidinium_carterae.1
MTARSVPINRIARELALELASGCYRPNIIEHLPGVLNTLADYASRVHAPEGPPCPSALLSLPPSAVPSRTASYFRCADMVQKGIAWHIAEFVCLSVLVERLHAGRGLYVSSRLLLAIWLRNPC